jgi:hypothetical protein
MLDSSSRLACHPVTAPLQDWEEATFTRPMRSPFAPEPAPAPVPEVDVSLEEAALFERPQVALRRRPTPPPPLRKSVLPPPRTDEETTSRNTVEPAFLRALRDLRDSAKLLQAAVDLGKTVEEPAYAGEVLLETSAVRPRR